MAGKIEINRITNANIYVNGNSLLGRADLPKLLTGEVTLARYPLTPGQQQALHQALAGGA